MCVDGREYRVSARVARIVAWLISRDERLARMERCKLTFNCAGRTVRAEISRTEVVCGGEA